MTDTGVRELLEEHQRSILRELDHARDDVRQAVAQMREDQRKDLTEVTVRLDTSDDRVRKIELRLGYLGALHAFGAAVLIYLAKKVIGF